MDQNGNQKQRNRFPGQADRARFFRQELLQEENIGDMDVVITLTDDEETNILVSLLAKKMGKTRVIAETGAGQHGVATATGAAITGWST